MAHEITNTDGMVLAGKQAWHGLGTVVEEAPTPYQALHLAGINWNVIEAPLSATTFTTDDDGMETPVRVQVPDRKCLLRDDTNEVLGIVSERYEVIQNREIADLIYEVATDDEITVESAGSLAGGKRIFFLCHLGTFGLDHGDDTVKQYALFRTGHDGKTEVSVRQTNVRVVCANTEAMALSKDRGVGFRHRGDIRSNIVHMQAALGDIKAKAKQFELFAEEALKTSMPTASDYFTNVYRTVHGKLPSRLDNPKAHARFVNTMAEWEGLRNHEWNAASAGTAWNAYNAVTQWATYDAPVRRTNGMSAHEARLVSRIDGRGNDYSAAAHKVLTAAGVA